MDKINFENGTQVSPAKVTIDGVDYPVTPAERTGNTPISAHVMNLLQSNIEKSAVAVSDTEPTTNEKVWIKGKEIYVKNDNEVFEKLITETQDTGWVDMSDYINTTYFAARPNYSPMARRINNIVYWKGEVYCTTVPNTKRINILQNIPALFQSPSQVSGSGVHYYGESVPYNIYLGGSNIVISQNINIETSVDAYGFQLSNISGYTTDNGVASEWISDFNTNVTNKIDEFNSNAINKTTSFNNNAETKTTDFNTNATSKVEEYNANAENKIAEYDAHVEELQEQIDDLKTLVDTELDTNTVSGTELDVNDSAEYPGKIEVKANMEQEKREGYNKLDSSKLSAKSANGLTATLNDKNNIVITGTSTSTVNFWLLNLNEKLEAGTYTFFTNVNLTNKGRFTLRNTTNNVDTTILNTSNTQTFTIEHETELTDVLIQINSGVTLSYQEFKLMIYKGTEAIDYEEYCGGQPSPNPDYPQPIKVVTGENVVKHCGNNPFDIEEYQLDLGDMELCKIDNYKDTIFKNVVRDKHYNTELVDGAWYKYKKINKQLINTNAMQLKDDYENIAYVTISKPADFVGYGIYANNKILCTHATYSVGGDWTKSDNEGRIFTGAQKNVFWLGIKKGTTLAEAKEKMDGMCIYYPILTPVYEQITEPTLISQLEALNKCKWFKGINHWWTETEICKPNLKGTYKQSNSLRLQALEQAVVALGGV